MSAAYLDSSLLLAILFGEPRSVSLRRILDRFNDVFSSDLLVAEYLSVAARERVDPGAVLLALRSLSLVLPSRLIESEIHKVLSHGYLRGADLWHVACALFVAASARNELAFLSTRDNTQRRIAARLGFRTP